MGAEAGAPLPDERVAVVDKQVDSVEEVAQPVPDLLAAAAVLVLGLLLGRQRDTQLFCGDGDAASY